MKFLKISLARLFFRSKPTQLLLSLKDGPKYATILSKEIDCTYSHTMKILDNFKKLGLVEFEKKGRIKMIKLTSNGEEIAKSLEATLLKLKKVKEKLE